MDESKVIFFHCLSESFISSRDAYSKRCKMSMKQSYAYQPAVFFLTSLVLASAACLAAAYVSYQPSLQHWFYPLILASLSSPTISALLLFAYANNSSLWADFCDRLRPDKIRVRQIPFLLFFMPCMVLLAITISLFFGFSSEQFSLRSPGPGWTLDWKSPLAILLVGILYHSLEEIGWRGYGIESLNIRYNLWKTSWIFALLWSLWHLPAFFVTNSYFQQEVWIPLFAVTYFMTLIPLTFIINWTYVKNNRSIISAILMHGNMKFSVALFQIQPFTKIIFMILLAITAALLVMRDKQLFFEKRSDL